MHPLPVLFRLYYLHLIKIQSMFIENFIQWDLKVNSRTVNLYRTMI